MCRALRHRTRSNPTALSCSTARPAVAGGRRVDWPLPAGKRGGGLLPTYPFDRQREMGFEPPHTETTAAAVPAPTAVSIAGREAEADPERWFWRPVLARAAAPAFRRPGGWRLEGRLGHFPPRPSLGRPGWPGVLALRLRRGAWSSRAGVPRIANGQDMVDPARRGLTSHSSALEGGRVPARVLICWRSTRSTGRRRRRGSTRPRSAASTARSPSCGRSRRASPGRDSI